MINADEIITKQLDKCLNVMTGKRKEYSPNEDRLHNFHVAQHILNCNTKQAIAGMMAKHTVSVYDMCNSGEDYPVELWEEKITDSINYMLLLRIAVEESRSDV